MEKSKVVISASAIVLAVLGGAAFAAQDKYTVKVPGGLAFSEFTGYESWQAVAISHSEKAVALILANPVMINAYRAGVPGNGKPFPDGSKMTKIHWDPKKSETAPSPTTVPGALQNVDFMVKDARGSPTVADGDGPRSSMMLRPIRSGPAPYPTSRRKRTMPSAGSRATRS
jgi:hypothetical protein